MKIKCINHRLLRKIVKVSITQLAIYIVFSSISMAMPVRAQELLETKVNLELVNVSLENSIKEIEKSSQVKFSYNSRALKLNQKVNLSANNESLSSVLGRLLTPFEVSYVQVSNRIVLRKDEKKIVSGIEASTAIDNLIFGDLTIKGLVTNAKGEKLPGVNIAIKGSTRGTSTNSNGEFTLAVPDNRTVLVFSFVGYKAQESIVGNNTNFNLVLVEDIKALDEVVVVGYGVQKKKDLTGAISSVDGEMFKERKETQVSQALQGSMSGVLVTRSGGNGAMSGATIRIRGITTIGNSNPLVIVDGVPVADVNQVNPNDIESLSVLKDAASASIYGSRAASGVILISTKRAKNDQISIQYNYEKGVDMPTQLPDYMRSVRYMELVNELRWNDAGNGTNKFPTFPQSLITDYNQNNSINPDKYPDTDWMSLTLRKVAPREAHSISLLGGGKTVKSSVSLRYETVSGLFENKDYGRIFLRSNNDFIVNKYIGGTVDVNFKRTITTDPTANDPLGRVRISAPIYPALWADGRIADGKAGENIYAKVKYGGTDDNSYNQVAGRIGLDIKPIEGLKLSAILAPIFDFNYQKRFNKQVDAYASDNPNQFLATLGNDGLTTRLDENRVSNLNLTTQFLGNYLKSFGQHDLTFLVGYENFYSKYESMGASRDQYLFDTYPYLNQGPATLRDNFGTAYETAYRSYFGRITYSFNNKYLFQANVRRDGSSRFNEAYRWGVFPSFSAGWVVSEEPFMKDQSSISFLKLRASWGELGNERIGNYPSVGIMNFGNTLLYQNNIATAVQTAAQVQYAIKDISWEKTNSTDLGIDAYFFNNRFRLTLDGYYKETRDMLLALQIPIFVGFENPNQNTGIMTTKGIDIDLGWSDNIGKLKYSVSANLSQFKSTMGDLGGTEFIGDKVKKLGSEFDEWFGYRAIGIYQTQTEVNFYPKLSNNVKVGDVRYEDISGPMGIPDGKISPDYDRVLLGGSQPQWMYGGNIRLDYRGFDLGITFQGIGYQAVSNLAYTDYNTGNWGVFPVYLDGGNTWSYNNTPEQNLVAKYPRFTETNKGLNRALSDFWLFDGGYFRLKNITLGYTVPNKISQKIMSKNMRLFVNATDIFTANKYLKGWDPEGIGTVSTIMGGFNISF